MDWVILILGPSPPPIVGDVENKRVFADSLFFQIANELAASFIEPFAHGVIFGYIFLAAGSLIFS